MAAFIDLTNQRFGRLLVLERAADHFPPSGKPQSQWLCHCDCGTEKVIQGQALRKGLTLSCGCLHKEEVTSRLTKHGQMPRGAATRTYNTWLQMRHRCRNSKATAYHRYGGRGITVCDRWQEFDNFYADMGERPAGKTLDRWPDNDGNYEPGNCRWATPREQAGNRGR